MCVCVCVRKTSTPEISRPRLARSVQTNTLVVLTLYLLSVFSLFSCDDPLKVGVRKDIA